MRKNKLPRICVLLLGILVLNVSTYAVQASINATPTVEIEVYVNEFDEDFIKNIEFDDGTKVGDYDYTVTYAPAKRINTSLGNYFSYAAWITRDGIVSLSLNPKSEVRTNSTTASNAWGTLADRNAGFGATGNWKNETVLKWQYDCHFTFAKNKDYWNLEPSRTANSYAEVVLSGCNP